MRGSDDMNGKIELKTSAALIIHSHNQAPLRLTKRELARERERKNRRASDE